MKLEEVNALSDNEARAASDEGKNKDYLLVKLNVFDVAFHNLEAAHVETAREGDTNFGFIPFPCGLFADLLLDAFALSNHDRSKKFLDIGSGFGSKVILASVLFDAYGIDYNAKHVEKARQLGLNRVGHCDAFKFDRYDIFDFIYYYRPIQNQILCREFELQVWEEAKVGAMIAPMGTVLEWDTECPNAEKMGKFWYRKTQ